MTTPAIATTPATFAAAPRPEDYNDAINLLAVLGRAERELSILELDVEHNYADIVDAHREVYAKLQATISETEAALEVIARRNPQWFGEKKNVATPYGVVKFTKSSEIVVADENVSVQLIEAFGEGEKFLRTVQVLNLQALAELSDAELARFALVRKAKENFKVETKVVDLGKAVKAADKTPRAASKTAKKAAAAVEGDA